MSTTLTATPLPDEGAIRLVLTASAPDWELVQLVRTDANGSRAVRLLAGAGLTGGTLIHTDAETALTGPVTYSATVRDPGDDSTETATASVDVTGVFTRASVGPVVIPAQAVDLDPIGIERYTARRSTSGTVTDVIGRADPVVSIGVQRTRRGRLTIWCRDYAQARAVEAAYGRGLVMMLRQPDYPGMDMYHVVDPSGGTSVDPYDYSGDTRRWAVAVDFVETAAPLGPLLGAVSWTLADSLARNPTLLASQAEFPTLLDLAIGPTP